MLYLGTNHQFLPPSTLKPAICFLSLILTILGPSRKWIHSASVILWPLGCTWHIFRDLQPWSLCQNVLSFKHWMMSQGVSSTPCFSHPLIYQWTLGLLTPFDNCENVAVNLGAWTFPFLPCFDQFGISRSGISVSYHNPILNFCLISAEFYLPGSNFSTSFLLVLLCCP